MTLYDKIERSLQKKNIDLLSSDFLNEINLISLNPTEMPAQIIGSFALRMQMYPGDIDLNEYYIERGNKSDVIRSFVPKFQQLIDRINRHANHYYSEVKAGIDKRYDIDIGKLLNGIYYPSPYLEDHLNFLCKNNLLEDSETKIIKYILSKSRKLSANDHDVIEQIFHNHKVLRWTRNEIMSGKKDLAGNKTISLEKACSMDTIFKLDIITFIQGNIIEITNVFLLGYYTFEGQNPIIFNETHPTLQEDIEKLWYSDAWYNPFKVVKRMFSLLRRGDLLKSGLVEKLLPLLSGNISQLYQIKSEISAILIVLDKIHSYSKKLINTQLNLILTKLSTNLELSNEECDIISIIVKKMINTTNKKKLIVLTKKTKDILSRIINSATVKYLDDVGMNPPPRICFPKIPKYNYDDIIRTPDSNPENPLNEYMGISGGNLNDHLVK